MINKNNSPLAFMACEAEYSASDIVLFGAPFDGTSSYRPGSRFAGNAVRTESFGIETYSPYLKRDLTDISVFDMGDLELPFGNAAAALQIIEEADVGAVFPVIISMIVVFPAPFGPMMTRVSPSLTAKDT